MSVSFFSPSGYLPSNSSDISTSGRSPEIFYSLFKITSKALSIIAVCCFSISTGSFASSLLKAAPLTNSFSWFLRGTAALCAFFISNKIEKFLEERLSGNHCSFFPKGFISLSKDSKLALRSICEIASGVIAIFVTCCFLISASNFAFSIATMNPLAALTNSLFWIWKGIQGLCIYFASDTARLSFIDSKNLPSKSSLHLPSSNRSLTKVGLQNGESLCFANAVWQAFYPSLQPFLSSQAFRDRAQQLDSTSKAISRVTSLKQFYDQYENLFNQTASKDEVPGQGKILRQSHDYLTDFITEKGGGQQDVEEFCRFFLSQIKEDLKIPSGEFPFSFTLSTSLSFPNKKISSSQDKEEFILKLPTPEEQIQSVFLQGLFNSAFKEETVQRSVAWKEGRQVNQNLSSLKEGEYEEITNTALQSTKIEIDSTKPLILYFGRGFMNREASEPIQCKWTGKVLEAGSLEVFGQKRRLIACIIHSGGMDGGHYLAYVKDKEGSWGRFNDAYVEDIKEEEALNASKDMAMAIYA